MDSHTPAGSRENSSQLNGGQASPAGGDASRSEGASHPDSEESSRSEVSRPEAGASQPEPVGASRPEADASQEEGDVPRDPRTGVPVGISVEDYCAGDGDLWDDICAQAARLKLRPQDVEMCRNSHVDPEKLPKDPWTRRHALNFLRRTGAPIPKWIQASGLFPDLKCDIGERRKRLRYLHQQAVVLIRWSLKRCEADALKNERSVYWEPSAEVCAMMEIAPSKLSALLKEFNGLSLSATIDCVRVECVKKVMMVEVKAAVLKYREMSSQGATLAGKKRSKVESERIGVARVLKSLRREDGVNDNGFAISLGFSSHRRLYRACVACFRKTPAQILMELIGVALADGEFVADFVEFTLADVEKMFRELQPIDVASVSEREPRREEVRV